MPNSRTLAEPPVVRAALAAQALALRDAVRALDEAELALPTRLGDWRVRELAAHLAIQVGWVPLHVDDPAPDGPLLGLTAWVAAVRSAADLLDEAARRHAAEVFAGPPAAVAAAFDEAVDLLTGFLAGPRAADAGRRFGLRFGPIALGDMLVTRLVETVVHADDLAHALGRSRFPHDTRAVAAVSALLLAALAERAAGSDVVDVVDRAEKLAAADPLAWIRVATGRDPVPAELPVGLLPLLG
ncbi:maleylpyruvate isomerase N-terminal domain-containing protein [Kitasatospora cinereorecta]|uniref:Maleylpyruvate isomerase N-terminal domain-containing protein n=1 Tax=Kitasatospora cinereorecta TaxID=285560 RepID=A0ABW0VMK9_9ACTN